MPALKSTDPELALFHRRMTETGMDSAAVALKAGMVWKTVLNILDGARSRKGRAKIAEALGLRPEAPAKAEAQVRALDSRAKSC